MQKGDVKTLNSVQNVPQSDRLKILVATPHTSDVEAHYAHAVALMFPAMSAQYRFEIFENALLSEGRTDMFKAAQAWDADYLFFIDSDTVFPADGLKRLIAMKRDIATGVYYKRVHPYHPVVYEFMPSGRVRNLTTLPDKPFKVDACGAGFMLISKKVLRAYTKEWKLKDGIFLDQYFGQPFHHITFMNDEGEPEQLSEDVSFCHRMKAMGFQTWAEPSIRLGHVSRMTIFKDHFDVVHAKELSADKVNDGEPDGWMTNKELDWLKKAAEISDGGVIEVGSWKGRSTKALLEGCKGTVTAVDHFKGSEDYEDLTLSIARAEPIYDIFMKNVGHYPNLKVMRMDSTEAAAQTPDKSVDMVFIDSDHRYEQVKAEIERWKSKARYILCGHDYSDGWVGVKQAVEESFEKFHVVGSIWIVEVSNGRTGETEKDTTGNGQSGIEQGADRNTEDATTDEQTSCRV